MVEWITDDNRQELNKDIDRFIGDYEFLSNFYPSPVEYDFITYPTVEHAYQAAKTDNLLQRKRIYDAVSPGRAKKIGKVVTLKENWDYIKVGIMTDLLTQKFSDPVLQKRLKQTGKRNLIEGNDWGDDYWGVFKGKGKNQLGEILMNIRNTIK